MKSETLLNHVVGIDQNYQGFPLSFDASGSSSTYQNNAPVQQEAVQYPYCIVVNTGAEEAERPINNYQVNNVYSYGMSQYYKGTMNNNSWLKSAGQWNDGTVYTGMYNWLLEQMNNGVNGFKGTIGYAWKKPNEDIRWWTATRNPKVGTAVYGGYGISYLGYVTAVNEDGTINFFEEKLNLNQINLVYTESQNVNIDGTGFGNIKFANDYDFVINTADQTFRLPLLNGEEDLRGSVTESVSGAVSGTSTTSFTATKNGWLSGKAYNQSEGSLIVFSIGGSEICRTHAIAGSAATIEAFIKTGQTISAQHDSLLFLIFTPAVGNGTLYYYVGDTLQNAQLINVARIEETLVTKTNKVQAAEASMPSGKYIDLTLGASGATYTAPANGWFCLIGPTGSSTAGYIGTNNLMGATSSGSNSYGLNIVLPVKKDDTVKIYYTSAETLRFIYAQGEQ